MVKTKLRKYEVTYTLWRETWSGRDQCDGTYTKIIKATRPSIAIKKLKKEYSKGWSHCLWITNEKARLLK